MKRCVMNELLSQDIGRNPNSYCNYWKGYARTPSNRNDFLSVSVTRSPFESSWKSEVAAQHTYFKNKSSTVQSPDGWEWESEWRLYCRGFILFPIFITIPVLVNVVNCISRTFET